MQHVGQKSGYATLTRSNASETTYYKQKSNSILTQQSRKDFQHAPQVHLRFMSSVTELEIGATMLLLEA